MKGRTTYGKDQCQITKKLNSDPKVLYYVFLIRYSPTVPLVIYTFNHFVSKRFNKFPHQLHPTSWEGIHNYYTSWTILKFQNLYKYGISPFFGVYIWRKQLIIPDCHLNVRVFGKGNEWEYILGFLGRGIFDPMNLRSKPTR